MRQRLLIGVVGCALVLTGREAQPQDRTAERLITALRAAGVAVVGVQIVDTTDRATWRVQPPALQPQAQPIIDTFDATAPAILAAELDTEARQMPRAMRAWMLFYLRDKLGRNPTQAERRAARDALIQAFKDVGP